MELKNQNATDHHIPVMKDEVEKYLNIKAQGTYLDGTIGAGGHAAMILSKNPNGILIGIDRDAEALKTSRQRLSASANPIIFKKESYHNFSKVFKENNIIDADGIILDLGLSSMQLNSKNRGFAFKHNGELDMRFDTQIGRKASQYLDKISQLELSNIIYNYSDERFSKKISKSIKSKLPMNKTFDLVNAINLVTPPHKRNKTLARVFQSIRIALNNELDKLNKFLNSFVNSLKIGGRIVIISYHSTEDRMVKHAYKKLHFQKKMRIITKKPIIPNIEEQNLNKKSRSAKLRAAERIG